MDDILPVQLAANACAVIVVALGASVIVRRPYLRIAMVRIVLLSGLLYELAQLLPDPWNVAGILAVLGLSIVVGHLAGRRQERIDGRPVSWYLSVPPPPP